MNWLFWRYLIDIDDVCRSIIVVHFVAAVADVDLNVVDLVFRLLIYLMFLYRRLKLGLLLDLALPI
jgi:hypothetical protein